MQDEQIDAEAQSGIVTGATAIPFGRVHYVGVHLTIYTRVGAVVCAHPRTSITRVRDPPEASKRFPRNRRARFEG